MVEASKFLLEDHGAELDSRKQYRLDYFGRTSMAKKVVPRTQEPADGPTDALLEWRIIKVEKVEKTI